MNLRPTKSKISGRWVSELELAVALDRAVLTPNLRRKLATSQHPAGPATLLGAESVHFIWDLKQSGRDLADNSEALVSATLQWLDSLLLQSETSQTLQALPDQGDAVQETIIVITASYGEAAKIASGLRPDFANAISRDLSRLASLNQCTPEEIIRRHLATTYVVAFCGFQPGFAYLEPLPGSPAIRAPRHEAPRAKVPAGAVALGGPYCGVYPSNGPGGWNIIGLTEMRFLDATSGRELWAPGDLVRFSGVAQ